MEELPACEEVMPLSHGVNSATRLTTSNPIMPTSIFFLFDLWFVRLKDAPPLLLKILKEILILLHSVSVYTSSCRI